MNWSHYPNFSREEFECQCGCGRADMHPVFMGKLQQVRNAYGKPMAISSGFRCPEHNSRVSSTGLDGPHTTGRAADVAVQHGDAKRLLTFGVIHFSGIGVKQKGGGRFLHFDDLESPKFPRPNVWSY